MNYKTMKENCKKVYISAPITGYDLEERKEAFHQWMLNVAAEGFEAVNPMEKGLPTSAPYTEHLKADLKLLLDCDGIAIHNKWVHSKGCRIEHDVARACGIPVAGVINVKTDFSAEDREAVEKEIEDTKNTLTQKRKEYKKKQRLWKIY